MCVFFFIHLKRTPSLDVGKQVRGIRGEACRIKSFECSSRAEKRCIRSSLLPFTTVKRGSVFEVKHLELDLPGRGGFGSLYAGRRKTEYNEYNARILIFRARCHHPLH